MKPLLLVMPRHGKLPQNAYHIAVVPQTANVIAKEIISYGLGGKNTITLSSRNDDGCMLSLQRNLITLSGKKLERQEILLPPLHKPEEALAIAGALLAADCPPSQLKNRMKEYHLLN